MAHIHNPGPGWIPEVIYRYAVRIAADCGSVLVRQDDPTRGALRYWFEARPGRGEPWDAQRAHAVETAMLERLGIAAGNLGSCERCGAVYEDVHFFRYVDGVRPDGTFRSATVCRGTYRGVSCDR